MGVVKKNAEAGKAKAKATEQYGIDLSPAEDDDDESDAPDEVEQSDGADEAEVSEVQKVNRKQLAALIQEKVRDAGKAVPITIAEVMVVAYEDAVIESLIAGSEVNLPGFGKFIATDKPAGEKRNPATGGVVEVPAHKQVRFKVGTGSTKAVNEGYASDEDAASE